MTAAELLKPPAAPPGTAGRAPAGLRLVWLHLRTRRVPAGILALAVAAAPAARRAALALDLQLRPLRAASPDDHRGGRGGGDRGDRAQPVRRDGTGRRALAALPAPAHRRRDVRAGDRRCCSSAPPARASTRASWYSPGTSPGSPASGWRARWSLAACSPGRSRFGYLLLCQYALLEGWRAPWTWPACRPLTAAPGSAPARSSRRACCCSPSAARGPPQRRQLSGTPAARCRT